MLCADEAFDTSCVDELCVVSAPCVAAFVVSAPASSGAAVVALAMATGAPARPHAAATAMVRNMVCWAKTIFGLRGSGHRAA